MTASKIGRWKLHGNTASYFSTPASLQRKPKADEPGSRILLRTFVAGSEPPPQGDGKQWLPQPPSSGKYSSSHLRVCAGFRHTWISLCPQKTGFHFIWLTNQSMGMSTDSWQKSSSFLQNINPLPALSVLESEPGRYTFKYLTEINI